MGLLDKAAKFEARSSSGLLSKIEASSLVKNNKSLIANLSDIDKIQKGRNWLTDVLPLLQEILKADGGTVLVIENGSNDLVHWSSVGLDETTRRRLHIPITDIDDKCHLITDKNQFEQWRRYLSIRMMIDLNSILFIPLAQFNDIDVLFMFFNISQNISLDDIENINRRLNQNYEKDEALNLGDYNLVTKVELEDSIRTLYEQNEMDHVFLTINAKTFIQQLPSQRDIDRFRLTQELLVLIQKLAGTKAKYFNLPDHIIIAFPTPRRINVNLWINQLNISLRKLYLTDSLDIKSISQITSLSREQFSIERILE
ncbi:hypothetical protein [Spirochaeta cellobiosiphila]|uniref:hypothetical protein n=1 Tax=Spirochaeta cellobiosiphila TaxID=504483 RepID=UPI00040E0A0B|nr:hypothetical protein [Spirochaeta cellobiosiphila]